MPKYVIRRNLEFTITITADDEESALNASSDPQFDEEWKSSMTSAWIEESIDEFDAEQSDFGDINDIYADEITNPEEDKPDTYW